MRKFVAYLVALITGEVSISLVGYAVSANAGFTSN